MHRLMAAGAMLVIVCKWIWALSEPLQKLTMGSRRVGKRHRASIAILLVPHMYHVHNVDHHHHVQDYLHDYDHVQEITNMFNITTSRTITISKYASREELLQSAMKAFVVTQVLQYNIKYKTTKYKRGKYMNCVKTVVFRIRKTSIFLM